MHKIKQDLRNICKKILEEKKTLGQWIEVESDDSFQEGGYVGGFDAIEKEFCFSVYVHSKEYWFQVGINDIKGVSDGSTKFIKIRSADK